MRKPSIRSGVLGVAITVVVVTGALASPALAAVRPAATATQASAVQWTVYRNPLYSHPWTGGGGRCLAESTVVYDGSTGNIHVMSRAKSTGPLRGCRAKGSFTMHINRWDTAAQQWFPSTRVHAFSIPTACSTTDPTCPSEVKDFFSFPLGVGEVLTGISNLALAKR